jgi:hypothetical protein
MGKDVGMNTSKKRKAGKSSGVRRAKLAKLRQWAVLSAFKRLKPRYQMQPFSEEAIDALEEELRKSPSDEDEVDIRKRWSPSEPHEEKLFTETIHILLESGKPVLAPRHTSRETLKKDLKALGIRSKLRKQRSG